jgi:hypothetical protein
LREDVRGKSTYLVRAALVLLVLFFLWITHISPQQFGAVGRRFFTMVAWIDLFIFSVVGLSYFASAITEEKESETLGLLRMTNLNALSILMGKSTSRLLGALFILAAQLPFMLVAVTMGGLAVNQVLAGFTCLLSYVFLLSNIGLFCSVIAKRGAGATMLSAAIICVLLVLPWYLYANGGGPTDPSMAKWIVQWGELTPFVQLGRVMWTGFEGAIFSSQTVASLAGGAAFFCLAWLLFDRFADPSSESSSRGRAKASPNSDVSICLRYGRPQIPALKWKDYHYIAGGGGQIAVLIKAAIVGLIIWACSSVLRFHVSGTVTLFGTLSSISLGLFLALCLAVDASRIFKVERDQQTLSSLMMLPFSVHRVIWQKTMGCLRSSWPAFGGLAVGLAILFGGIVDESRRHPSAVPGEAVFYGTCGFLHAVFTGLLLPVLVAWLSLRMRWGALPVGATIWALGSMGAVMIIGLVAEEGAFVLLPMVSFGLLVFFWTSIPAKLEQLAAEE